MLWNMLMRLIAWFYHDTVAFLHMIEGWFLTNYNVFEDIPDGSGKIAVVTGGSRGIGKEVVKILFKTEMTVIVGSRKPYTLISDIEKLNYKGKVVHIPLDLGSLKSVREFAALVNENYKSIDILVNNAAIVFDDSYNEDGIDTTLCTNYAGHFLLTHLLLDNLKKGGQEGNVMSRIVNVSSCAHKLMNLDLNDLKFSKFRYNYLVYGRTKLAQLMFSKYLNRILEKNNVKVRSYAVHPGIVHTEMADPKDNNLIHKLLLMKPEKAATSIIYTCFSPHLERRGGHYISNCMESYCTNFSKDKIKQEELFKKTMQMLNIEKFGNLAIL